MGEAGKKVAVPPELEAVKIALTESWERIRERVERENNELRLEVSGLLSEEGEGWKAIGMMYEEGPPPREVFHTAVEEVRDLEEITGHLGTDLEKFVEVRTDAVLS